MKSKYVFVDYEGTLSEKAKGHGRKGGANLNDQLFSNVYKNLPKIDKVYNYLVEFDPKNIYVVGTIETNKEIEQKYRWIKRNYPFIIKKNIVFISEKIEKASVIDEYVLEGVISKKEVLFIDDKDSHLDIAKEHGYKTLKVDDIK